MKTKKQPGLPFGVERPGREGRWSVAAEASERATDVASHHFADSGDIVSISKFICVTLSFIALGPELHRARERAQGDDGVNEVGVEAAQLAAELLGALPFWSVLRRSRRAACTHLGLLVGCGTQRTL